MNFLTSFVFNLDLNLARRSIVVTGVFGSRTALISSSVTGPVAGADTLFDDVGGIAPLGCAALFMDEAFSSFTALVSCIPIKDSTE